MQNKFIIISYFPFLTRKFLQKWSFSAWTGKPGDLGTSADFVALQTAAGTSLLCVPYLRHVCYASGMTISGHSYLRWFVIHIFSSLW